MAADTALQAERIHLELARTCLVAMRESADRIADYGVDELASHALGSIRAARLAALQAEPDAPPFFGRTDRDAPDGPTPDGRTGGRGVPHRAAARA